MNYKNLKNCWDGLERQFSKECPKNVILLDQKDHDEIMLDKDKKKPSYFRSMKKIMEHLKKDKAKNQKKEEKSEKEEKEEDNANNEYFNKNNILILESEEEKMGDDTKSNSIMVNLFSEKYLEFNEKEKQALDLEGDKVINYVYKLLENCTDDIRSYINRYKITDEYAKI